MTTDDVSVFRKALNGLRTVFNHVNGFLLLVFGMKKHRSSPGASKARVTRLQEATHVGGGKGGAMVGYSSSADNILGQAITEDHNQQVHGDPGSERPVTSDA